MNKYLTKFESLTVILRNLIEWKYFLIKNKFPVQLNKEAWSLGVDDFTGIFESSNSQFTHKRIIYPELESGISRIINALFLRKINPQNLVLSVEGDLNWANKVNTQIVQFGLENSVRLFHVPYELSDIKTWFDSNGLKRILTKKVDVLLVDAPSGSICPTVRKPAIPFFLPWLHNQSIVLLHDSNRTDESGIADDWGEFSDQEKPLNQNWD